MSSDPPRVRVPPLAPPERSERQAALIARAGAELGVYTTLVRHPDLFADLLPFGQHLLERSTLDPRVRELLILRTAWRCRAPYVWTHHEIAGRAAGLTGDDLVALGTGTVDPADPLRAVLLRAADELVAAHRLGDSTWAGLADRFGQEQLIEICLLVGQYVMLAGTLNSLGVRVEPGYTPPAWTGR